MQLFQDNKKPFLERLVDLDIESRYTKKVRIGCHISLWLFFWILSVFMYLKSFNLPNAALFAFRNVICDAIFFYFFFYNTVKLLLNKNFFILFFFGTILSVLLWVLSNYYLLKIIDFLFSPNNKPIYDEIHSYAQKNIVEIVSFKSLSSQLFVVLSFVAIPSFVKILFDITRYYSKFVKQELSNQKLQIEKINLEKDFLLAQLNPHFLFNTFNNLYALALKQSPMLPNILEKLSDIMRYTVYDVKAESVYLQSEIDFVNNYIALEKLRHSDKSDIQLILKNEIPKDFRIAPLLIFPFVENAFKYGLKTDNKFIRIYINHEYDELSFRLENDISIENNIECNYYGGIGIQNVKNRLELLYKKTYQLEIHRTKDKFTVELKIKLQ